MMKRLVGLLALLISANASGREIEDRVAALAVDIDQIVAVSQDLETKVAPGRGFITEDQAIQRFQDHVYLHMIGEYELAAEGFFALVTTAALSDSGLHRDAEWYLAETLFQMGNYVTAEARFQVIAEDENHPFRDDGVRRLLELYAATNQTRSFYHYYERDIVRGRVKPSDLITYTVAKSFYQQGDLVQAKSHLLEIGENSNFFRKARYFLGAVMTREGDLEAAAGYFREVAELPINTLEDRQLLDLSLLALGRIYYELGDFGQASEFYSKISGDSEYLADKLYEIVWSFIKQAEIDPELVSLAQARDAEARDEVTDALNHTQQALRGVEIFLLAFPEHEFTAQLKLLEGHLHMQVARYDGAISTYEKTTSVYDAALSAYEQVIVDYTPVKEYFGRLADSDEEGKEYFKAVLTSGGTAAHSKLDSMPAYARAMMAADKDLAHAMTVYRELGRQDRNIRVSERLIDELSAILSTSSTIGGFEEIRYEALLNSSLSVDKQLLLLEYEEEWLVESSADAKSLASDLTAKRKQLFLRTQEAQEVLRDAKLAMANYDDAMHRRQFELTELFDKSRMLKSQISELRIDLSSSATTAEQRERINQELADLQSELNDIDARLSERKGGDEREALQNKLVAAEKDLDREMSNGVKELRGAYRSARSGVSNTSLGIRFDELHRQLEESEERLDAVVARLNTMEASEMARIKARFQHEIQEVASQRVELQRSLSEAEEVSIALTRNGFGRLEDFFGESVLRANMGIVDVYWAQKLEVVDEKNRVKEERNLLLADLESRFSLIKQKLRH